MLFYFVLFFLLDFFFGGGIEVAWSSETTCLLISLAVTARKMSQEANVTVVIQWR